MKILIAMTGASGAAIGFRLLEELSATRHTIYGIISENARWVIRHELGENAKPPSVVYYDEYDQMAPFNSSSFLLDAMVITPCSMKTLAAIASGYSHSLITRTAENMLRVRSKLILMPRETPLSTIALDNMTKLSREGAIILPPTVAYYHKPEVIDDITKFFVGKILDILKIPNQLYRRWGLNPD
ncbi:UbiX family flavin prenyltransferase [candidate division KSB1 bacterium]|nr:UbiX family flavin prenyltransferase [candidate division KSB1 bacterium]